MEKDAEDRRIKRMTQVKKATGTRVCGAAVVVLFLDLVIKLL